MVCGAAGVQSLIILLFLEYGAVPDRFIFLVRKNPR